MAISPACFFALPRKVTKSAISLESGFVPGRPTTAKASPPGDLYIRDQKPDDMSGNGVLHHGMDKDLVRQYQLLGARRAPVTESGANVDQVKKR